MSEFEKKYPNICKSLLKNVRQRFIITLLKKRKAN